MKAHDRIVRARTNLLMDEPFFGVLALRLKLVDDASCKTVWTDATTLGYNPGYVDSLNDAELKGLLAKEILHIAAGHPWRQDKRETRRWQRACSEAIVPLVQAAGLRLPLGTKANPEYAGMSAEAIYAKLAADAQGNEQAGSAGGDTPSAMAADPGSGDASPSAQPESGAGPEAPSQDGGSEGGLTEGATDEALPGEVRQAPQGEENLPEWKLAMEQATHMQGDLPGGIDRLVRDLLKSTVDWKEVLRHFFETSIEAADYTWKRPSSRYVWQGLYLPTLEGQAVPKIVIVRDTSASIAGKYLQMFNAEVLDILDSVKPEALYVLDVDTTVQKVQSLLSDEAEAFEGDAKGGGGTRFEPAFEWVEQEQVECTCMIYLTDLLGSFPKVPPEYPVLWVSPEGSNLGTQPPFGDFVELTVPA